MANNTELELPDLSTQIVEEPTQKKLAIEEAPIINLILNNLYLASYLLASPHQDEHCPLTKNQQELKVKIIEQIEKD